MKGFSIAVIMVFGMFSFSVGADGIADGRYYFARDGFFGGSPGKAKATISANGLQLANNVIACEWSVEGKSLRIVNVEDKSAKKSWDVRGGSMFRVVMGDGRERSSADFEITRGPKVINLKGQKEAPRFSNRLDGKALCLSMKDPETGIQVEWDAVLREGSNYIRQRVTIRAIDREQDIKGLVLVDLPLDGASKGGLVDGCPVFADQLFTALEHPMAKVSAESGRVQCTLERSAPLKTGESFSASAVIGVTIPGQTRRGFQYYVERERIHPYRQFLHYNSWYDIAWPGYLMNEKQCIDVIELLGQKLVRNRNVKIDSFVFDDGWDDFTTLWGFHDGFPDGFTPHKKVASKYNTNIGTWISPWGGYGNEQKARIKYGKTQGFETNSGGFSLAGKNYNRRFTEVCERFMRDYDCNYFKFDGIGGGVWAAGAPRESTPDVEALLKLAGNLHEKKPSLFINATVGTWPSPYLLWSVDSIWRQGHDLDLLRTSGGTKRDQWITYRDGMVYSRIFQRSPHYPLNSLMYVGIALAKLGTTKELNNDVEAFKRDARSFFATGTNCQELYITGKLFSDAHWDVLAESARWAKANQAVLVDSHWIGGNPNKGEVYGYTSWSPGKAVLMLRNPSNESQDITVDLGECFELPTGSPSVWRLKSAWAEDVDQPVLQVVAGEPCRIDLKPLEVAVLEAKPVKGSKPYKYTGYEEKRKGYRVPKEQFVGFWEYPYSGATYRRQFNIDGTAQLYVNGQPLSVWNGFTWEYDDGRIIVRNADGLIDGVHKLVDADTLVFVLHNFEQAKRVK
ncbi:MAG: enterotoxin [Planctomycetes bacterium]|nr:enterotoxin [Planctomycetota bacterium]